MIKVNGFWAIAALGVLAGCAGKFPATMQPATPQQAVQTPVAPQAATVPASPYGLTAKAAGPYVSFSLTNNSPSELEVKKEHFAVIVLDESRQVVPYDKHSSVIDLPEVSVLQPGATVQGRAQFKEFPKLVGKRLVYKSTTGAAFADITQQS